MADPHVLSTLRDKRNVIERTIAAYQAKIEDARIDLMHVNAVLHLFEYAPETISFPLHLGIGRLFNRGELFALCLAALRESPEGLDTRELSLAVIRAKRLDEADRVLRSTLALSIVNVMRRQWKRGSVSVAGMRKGVRVWISS